MGTPNISKVLSLSQTWLLQTETMMKSGW